MIKILKSVIILKCLLNDQVIKFPDGLKYAISDNNEIGFFMTKINENKTEEILCRADHLTLNGFISECEKFTDNDVYLIGSSNALTIMQRKKSQEREDHFRKRKEKK